MSIAESQISYCGLTADCGVGPDFRPATQIAGLCGLARRVIRARPVVRPYAYIPRRRVTVATRSIATM